jgi:two-component system OmpR family response regulator
MTRVLVVEDEIRALEVIQRGLLRRGYEVAVAATARDAISLARSFKPQVLLTDWLLKDTHNGLDVAEALRELNPALVLVFFSGVPMDKLQAAARHLQPCSFLEKPFGLHTLEACLQQALHHTTP